MIAAYGWVTSENQKLTTLYEQASFCASETIEQRKLNCRENITVTIHRKWITAQPREVRGGGSTVSGVGFEVTRSNGDGSTVHVGANRDDAIAWVTFLAYDFPRIKAGDQLYVETWRGKFVRVWVRADKLRTSDHPETIAQESYPRLFGISACALIALIVWTGYELSRQRRVS